MGLMALSSLYHDLPKTHEKFNSNRAQACATMIEANEAPHSSRSSSITTTSLASPVAVTMWMTALLLSATESFAMTAPEEINASVVATTSTTTGDDGLVTSAGKWFFVAYVAVSLAAGLKEAVTRIQNWSSKKARNEDGK